MKQQIFNPYLPSYEYIPDGEPHVFDDRLYIYGSHDCFGGNDYCINDYVCWSAPLDDLSDFRYEGVIYKKTQHPHSGERNNLFAPDVAKGKDGRYYLYYSVAHSSVISVAVCNTPAGKYEYLGDVHDKSGHVIGSTAGDYYQFDPGVFVDDDGRIFLFSGFNPSKSEDEAGRKYVGCHMCELEDDMLTVKSGPHIVIERDAPDDRRYFEAPSLRKFNKKYYLIYSVKVGGLHYYISDRPDGGFTYGGRIHSTSDVGINGHSINNPAYPNGNTHGSIIELNGKYYVFDHRLTNNSSYCRQGVAEQIYFDENGYIAQVESTSCGLNDGPLIGKGTYPAYIACTLIDNNTYSDKEEKIRLSPCITQDGNDRECEPGQYIHGIHDNCLIGYKYFSFDHCENVTLTIRGIANGTLHIKTSESGADITNFQLELNSSEWSKVTMPLLIDCEKSAFYLEWQGDGQFDLLDFCFK